MKLGGLVLYTQYFEDYLSFLIEVLELDLTELSEHSMKLTLQSGFLEIKRIASAFEQTNTTVVFELETEDFLDLVSKISFFYYRKGPSRFNFQSHSSIHCELTDPDGRIWQFKLSENLDRKLSYHAEV